VLLSSTRFLEAERARPPQRRAALASNQYEVMTPFLGRRQNFPPQERAKLVDFDWRN
jgi:hypothetical protein